MLESRDRRYQIFTRESQNKRKPGWCWNCHTIDCCYKDFYRCQLFLHILHRKNRTSFRISLSSKIFRLSVSAYLGSCFLNRTLICNSVTSLCSSSFFLSTFERRRKCRWNWCQFGHVFSTFISTLRFRDKETNL